MMQRNRWKLAITAVVGVVGMAVASVVTLASAEPPAVESDSVTPSPQERAAVLQLWAQQFDAWARADAEDYAGLFTPDGEMVVFDGTRVATRESIEEYMAFVFPEFLQDTTLSAEVESMRKVAPQTIVMISIGCVLRPGEVDCPAEALSRQTNVIVMKQGQWWFSSFQNTRITPAG
jgi:uncharacterized protein (TIGR02246 family)